MATVKIKQVKSAIGYPQRQKDTVRALGITKMNQVVEHEATPQIMGMIEKIKHLVVII
jgi:large subunit ribosomal protein L30